jgi:hypothetical protein
MKLPPFDYCEHKPANETRTLAYLRIKSKGIMFASQVDPNAADNMGDKQLVIVPTDDEALKVVLIPEDMLSGDLSQGAAQAIHKLMQTVAIRERPEDEMCHVYMPCFKSEVLSAESPVVESLHGIKVDENGAAI